MACSLIYRDFEFGDELLVSDLIKEVFLEFVDAGLCRNDSQVFLKSQEPEVINCRLKFGDRFVIIAESYEKSTGKNIAGIIEVKNYNHIALLFIKKERQRQGIAKVLLDKAIKRCLEVNPALEAITLNSTDYARPIYEKLGFEKSIREFDGLTSNSTSMVLSLK